MVERVDEFTAGSVTAGSSTRLRIRWTPPDEYVEYYALRLVDQVAGAELGVLVAGDQTATVVENLKSGTLYEIQLTACLDFGCIYLLPADPGGEGRTDEEYWQIQGAGASFETAAEVVTGGQDRPYAVVFESWAGPTLQGRLQLHYDPAADADKGVRMALLPSAATADSTSVMNFEPVPGAGLRRRTENDPPAPGPNPFAFQPVPLSEYVGWAVRLFFQSDDPDGRGRIYSLDSRDGYPGLDYNSEDASAICELSDYGPAGPCEPSVVLGVDGDGVSASPGVERLGPFRIGYPTRDSWQWQGTPGTFMFVSVSLTADMSGCSEAGLNAGYAVFDGTDFGLAYKPPMPDQDPCPLLLEAVQSPSPVHLGGVRYKLYYSRNDGTETDPSALRPVELVYGDGQAAGDPTVVEFSDWERVDQARPVHFLWPDGAVLTDESESRLTDFHPLMPTSDPGFQVMFVSMPCDDAACPAPAFVGMAVLLNP